jgi:phage shock protein E
MSIRAFTTALFLITLAVFVAACGAEPEAASPQAGEDPGAAAAAEEQTMPGEPGSTVRSDAGNYRDLTPEELAGMLQEKDFVLINTHIPYEGEIEQTDLFIPYDEALERVDELPAELDAKIVVYCRSDRMSRLAVEDWLRAGYTNLYNLDGGFVAWDSAGYDLLHE